MWPPRNPRHTNHGLKPADLTSVNIISDTEMFIYFGNRISISCKSYFTLDEGFVKMKNHEDKITSCMNMYYSGMSLRKIQSHLKMFTPKNSHYSSIYR